MTQRCIIVGAGIVGACIGLRIAEMGVDVTIIEAQAPGQGATGNSFAWFAASHPSVRYPEPYFSLHLSGVEAYRRLVAEWPVTDFVHRVGCLTWSTSPDEQGNVARQAHELRDSGYNAAVLDSDWVARRLAPSVDFPDTTSTIAFFPDEGYVDGKPLVGRLLHLACAAGAHSISGKAVEIVCEKERAKGVLLASGDFVEGNTVIVACGRSSADLLSSVSFELPLVSIETRPSAAVGLLVITRPLAKPISTVLIADQVMIRPDGGGRLLVHDFRVDELVGADTPLDSRSQPAVDLLRNAAKYVPELAHVPIEAIRIGHRVLPADGLPVVGRVPGTDGVYVATTHSGITLAPLLGELVTEEVLTDADHKSLSSFRPDRFQASG